MDGWRKRPEGWEEVDYQLFHPKSLNYLQTKLEKYDKIDYIYVLAGGLNEFAENHQWVTRRLDLAIALYRIRPRKIICLGGGTYHKPPCVNHSGFVIHESTACAQYLMKEGVDPKDIMREWSSYDTIANGAFALFNFAIPLNIKKCAVITSDFHMPRSKLIFHWIFSLYQNNQSKNKTKIKIIFLSVDSKDLDKNIINGRIDREKQSIHYLNPKIKEIDTLEKFHTWFFTEHKSYNCDFGYLQESKKDLDDTTKNSY